MIDQPERIEGRCLRIALTPEEKDTTTWAQVDTSDFSDDKRQKFEKRRQAIMAYMSGERVSNIVNRLGISEWEIRRFRNRCLERHPDGRIWGFRALVPGIHQLEYVRLPYASGVKDYGRYAHDETTLWVSDPKSLAPGEPPAVDRARAARQLRFQLELRRRGGR